MSVWRYINDTWLLYRILSFLSALCKSPTHIFSAAWMQMTEVCMFFCLFVCGCEWACHTVESDGLLTQRISDLESISCIIHRRSVCDTHLCARQSVRTSGPRFRCLWPGKASFPQSLLCSALLSLSVRVINSHRVINDQHVQEWDGIPPELPFLFCFFLNTRSAGWSRQRPPLDPSHQQPVQVSLQNKAN